MGWTILWVGEEGQADKWLSLRSPHTPPLLQPSAPTLTPSTLCVHTGIKGKDFVMLCSDTSAVHSVISIKQDEDKIVEVDSHTLFSLSGEAGDRVQFSDFIIANVKLYALRNSTELSTKSIAHFTRGELATALRKVNALPCFLQRSTAPPQLIPRCAGGRSLHTTAIC